MMHDRVLGCQERGDFLAYSWFLILLDLVPFLRVYLF